MALLHNTALLVSIVMIILSQVKVTVVQDDYVKCNDQQEMCECNEQQNVCKFRLDIEELQTFTSYRINRGQNGDLLTRGTPGRVYFMDNSGFHPSVQIADAPESNSCNTETNTIERVEQFRSINCSIPMFVDGRTYRTFIAVNGQIPGPTLIVNEGQDVYVDVYNRLTSEGVTIHWHGLHQRGTPYMDGVAFVSQAPITPGAVFQYRFKPSPVGTHWYHSHLGAQRTDGLYGALIVREKNITQAKEALGLGEFEDNPDQHTLTLLDFQRESSLNLFVQIHSTLGFYPGKPLSDVPTPSNSLYFPRTYSTDGVEVGPIPYWSGLINGRGRYTSTTYSLLSVFTVQPNTAYRFRLIGAQSLYAYKFEIVGHNLTVIATDGHFIEPVVVDYIIIHTGERYDFILNATQNPDNYMIRAQTLEVTNVNNNPQFLNNIAEGVLHYNITGVLSPNPLVFYANVRNENRTCNSIQQCAAINCPFKSFPTQLYIRCVHLNELNALFPSSEKDIPTLDLNNIQFLNFGFEGDSSTSAINGRNFILPSTPYQTYLGQYDKDRNTKRVQTCQKCAISKQTNLTENCRCIHSIEIPGGRSVVMILSVVGDANSSFNNFSHPVHLHGHSFHVVNVSHGSYNNLGLLNGSSPDVECSDKYCLKPNWRNGIAPEYLTSAGGEFPNTAIQKDTVIVPAGGYVVIAFQADNPGYWFMHCHIESHQLEGMGVIVREYPDGEHPKPPYGINNVGDFLWTKRPNDNKSCSRTGVIVLGIFLAILLILCIMMVPALILLIRYKCKHIKSASSNTERVKIFFADWKTNKYENL